MLGGSIIVQTLKGAIKTLTRASKGVAKIASKGATRFKSSGFYKSVAQSSKEFASKMGKNLRTKRWWGRAVRVIRSSRAFLGIVGGIGASLRNRGGLLGLFGRGLSIFDTDYRSPKEFRKDMKLKETELTRLKSARDALIKKQKETQDELKMPVITEGLETTDEKIDELAKHLTQMKQSLSQVQATSFSSDTNIKGFEAYQIKVNKQLADAINHGADINLQSTTAVSDDIKSNVQAVVADSSANIVGEITAKIDAIEDQRQEEEEFRRKNNWKRKLLNSILFLADWFLNWPFKLGMIALKLGLILAAYVGAKLLPHVDKIMILVNALKNGMGKLVGAVILAKLYQFGAWLVGKISQGIQWLAKKIINSAFDLRKSILEAIASIAPSWMDGFIEKVIDGGEKARNVSLAVVDGLQSLLQTGLDVISESADKFSKEAMAIMDVRNKAAKKDSGKAFDMSGKDLVEKESGQLVNEVSQKHDSSGNGSVEQEDLGILGNAERFIKDKAEKGLGQAEKISNNKDLLDKARELKAKVVETGDDLNKKVKASIEASGIKEASLKAGDRAVDAVDTLSKSLEEKLDRIEKAAYKNKPNTQTQVKQGSKIAFKESGNQYQNLNQQS